MDVFQQFAADEVKENSGVWKDIGGGASLLVARAGNRKYARLLSRLVEENQRALDVKNDAADALSDQILIEVTAQTVLLGWKSLEFKGESMAYAEEAERLVKAKTLLAVKDFRALVARLSNDFDSYRAMQEEAAAKN